MKVTALKPFRSRAARQPDRQRARSDPLFRLHLVSVRTDAGIIGENLIFTLNGRRTKVLRQMVDELADLIIGRDAGHIADFWARAWKDINFLGHKGVPVVGISALDGALWDALGKASRPAALSIARRRKDDVPAYQSGGLWLSSSTEELVAEAERFVAQGFRAMKMRLGSPDPNDRHRARQGGARCDRARYQTDG